MVEPIMKLGDILTVDLSRESVERKPFPPDLARKYLAGRGINAYFLCSEKGTGEDGFSPDNLLVMSCGLLTGTRVPASARLHISAKSPLTGGLGSSNVGGGFGVRLRAAGIQTLVIKNKALRPLWLSIGPDHADLLDAAALWGRDTLDTPKMLARELGAKDLDVAVIGIGGENLVRYAGIMVGHGHTAGRTGMGAVMGAKKLKAIAVQAPLPKAKAEKGIKEAVAEYNKAIMDAPRYKLFSEMSNTFVVDWANDMGILTTRNFQKGVFEGAGRINGKDMLRHVTKRKSCHRCPVHCRAEINIKKGPYAGTHGERPDLEPIMTLGAKCGLDDSDAIMGMHNLCNRLGIDSLSAGSSIAFAMEAFEKKDITPEQTDGMEIRWGDSVVMTQLIEKIANRRGFGNILAEGVARASKKIGGDSHRYAHHSKGLELTGFDPRGLKATGLGYAVSTRGGDFTSVYALPETKWAPDKCEKAFGSRSAADRFAHEGKGKVVRLSAIVSAVIDALGICKVPALSLIGEFDLKREAQLVSLLTGWQMDAEALFEIGERIFNLENLFNIRNSPWQPRADIPEMFCQKPLTDGPSLGQTVDLESMVQDFYRSMGWDTEGRPRCATLKKLEIEAFARSDECV
jgi:aldehyde:ferredoxin oxidoreductase